MRWSARKSNGRWPVGIPRPSIPSIGTTVPVGEDWLHEIKHDGYRLLVRKDGDAVSIITRGGSDWTERYPLIVEGALRLRGSFVIDGEGVVCGEDGVADFELLQSRKHDRSWTSYQKTLQTLSLTMPTRHAEFLMFCVPAGRPLDSDVYIGLPTESLAAPFDGFVPVKEIDLPNSRRGSR